MLHAVHKVLVVCLPLCRLLWDGAKASPQHLSTGPRSGECVLVVEIVEDVISAMYTAHIARISPSTSTQKCFWGFLAERACVSAPAPLSFSPSAFLRCVCAVPLSLCLCCVALCPSPSLLLPLSVYKISSCFLRVSKKTFVSP